MQFGINTTGNIDPNVVDDDCVRHSSWDGASLRVPGETIKSQPPTGKLTFVDTSGQDLRLECLRFAKGDLDRAKELLAFVYGPMMTMRDDQ